VSQATCESVYRDLYHERPGPFRRESHRIEALTQIVLDLMVEVEALRGALLTDPSRRGDPVNKGSYASSYRDTAYLTHDASGCEPRVLKLMQLFYPSERESLWREILMLRRLGFSEKEIDLYKEEAKRAEMFT
jgi:hypothetical protein